MALSLFGNDPFSEMKSMQRHMNSLFNGFFREGSSDNQLSSFDGAWAPSVDVRETKDAFVVHAELPGMSKEDINVNFEDGYLTLSGEKKHEKREENERYHRIERSYGKFQRSFALPDGVDASKINASFDNGVLELTVPKPPQKETTSKKIDIK